MGLNFAEKDICIYITNSKRKECFGNLTT